MGTVVDGYISSSSSEYGGSVSSSSPYYFQCDGDTLRLNTQRTPASSSADGYVGEICTDSNYIYVCIATNTWTRVALSSF
jgi:hypothetical protein